MQSIFRLPWCSDPLGGDQKQDVLLQKMRQGPVVDVPLINKLKRKRSDSPELLADVKRQRPCDTEPPVLKIRPGSSDLRQAYAAAQTSDSAPASSPDTHSTSKMDDGAPLTALVASDLSPLQQMIKHQFNLEILRKHREKRLIEQEIAKCQVALEQLRRCELIPYPGQQDFSADVSAGVGPGLRPPVGHTQPVAPAPWGVTDGPYSRHYASWLLRDHTFDPSTPISTASNDPFAGVRLDRSTRNTGASWAKATKNRVRESVGLFNPHPAPTPAPARNKGGPLVLKRLSDNQFVKLVCTKCHRSDFSSVQGFLNHCRIAHKIDYKSHEAAAQDCGQILEGHETELAATAPPPVGTTVRTPAPKPQATAPTSAKVHHLNQEFMPRPTWKRQRLAYVQSLNSTTPVKVETPQPSHAATTSLVSSSATPFLSAHLARRGVGINLAAIIAKLGEKIDLGPEILEEAEESQSSTHPSTADDVRTTAGKLDRPLSRKGFNQGGHRPRPAPISAPPPTHPLSSSQVLESPRDHNLSPHTADSDPGLVSDHEDEASDSEEVGSVIVPPDSIPLHGGCGGDAMDLDIQVDDDHDGHGVIIRSRCSMRDDANMHDAGSPSTRPRGKFSHGNK